jgi:hypothetical protein
MRCLNQHSIEVHGDPRPRWRKAFEALALPAMRVHNYRNLHRTMFYDTIGEFDCKEHTDE